MGFWANFHPKRLSVSVKKFQFFPHKNKKLGNKWQHLRLVMKKLSPDPKCCKMTQKYQRLVTTTDRYSTSTAF
jgi:hypothetical protein